MVNSLFDITGKKAIVTGGTRGLGKGMAEGLMESGAEVAIIGTSDKVYQVADEFKARGFVCYGVKADLSDRDQCNEAFNKCVELLGDLDILVPAHGIQRRHPSNEFPDKDWDDVINTNLNSVFWLSRAASNIFKAKGYGKIITFTLQSEPGTSLKAAGWTLEAAKAGKPRWNKERYATKPVQLSLFPSKQPPAEYKQRWAKALNQKEDTTT